MWTAIALIALANAVWLNLLAIDSVRADYRRLGKRWRPCASWDVLIPSIGLLCMILTCLYALTAMWLPIVWLCWH